MNDSATEPLLEARLSEHPLADLLKGIALSRQRLELRFLDSGELLGTIGVVAGQVFRAVDLRTGALGVRGARALLGSPGTDVAVVELGESENRVSAVCELAELSEALALQPPDPPAPIGPALIAAAPQGERARPTEITGVEESIASPKASIRKLQRLVWWVLGLECATLLALGGAIAWLISRDLT